MMRRMMRSVSGLAAGLVPVIAEARSSYHHHYHSHSSFHWGAYSGHHHSAFSRWVDTVVCCLLGALMLFVAGKVIVDRIRNPGSKRKSRDVVRCRSCRRRLDREGDPLSEDRGGQCVECAADAGDADSVERMAALRRSGKVRASESSGKVPADR